MARKRYTTEQIIGLLREAEVRLGQGQAVGAICRGFGISEQSSYTLAARVRRSEARPGQAPQGSGAREQPAQEGGV